MRQNKAYVWQTVLLIATLAFMVASMVAIGISQYKHWNSTAEDYATWNIIAIIVTASCFLVGFAFIFFISKKGYRMKPVKADILQCNTGRYEDFHEKLSANLQNLGYGKIHIAGNDSNCTVELYGKHTSGRYENFLLVHMNELNADILETYGDLFWNSLNANNEITESDDVFLIPLICVKRLNRFFSMHVDRNVFQLLGKYQLPVGLSLSSKKVYIANQKGGLFKQKYNYLRKILLQALSGVISN